MKLLQIAALVLCCIGLRAQLITHGPIVGAVTPNSARCVAVVTGPTNITIDLSTDNTFSIYRSFSKPANASNGYITVLNFDSLQPNTKYYYRAQLSGQVASDTRSFMTYPCPGESLDFTFTFGSCQTSSSINSDEVFDEMKNHNSRFFLQVGDWGYPDDTDDWPNNSDYFPVQYNRVINSYKTKYSFVNMKNFMKNVPVDYIWDDHDYVNNNSSRLTSSYFEVAIPPVLEEDTFPAGTRRNAIKGYYELYPAYEPVDSTEGTFHKFRFGNVEVFMLDNRAARSANNDAFEQVGNDFIFNPPQGHTILGDIQRQWLLDNLRTSTATWKVIVGATAFNKSQSIAINNVLQLPQLAGVPLASALADSWSGFPMDQDSLINCVNDNNIDGVVMFSGDTHTSAIDNGQAGGLPEIMAGCLSQTNSTLVNTVPLLTQGLVWSEGGQGIGNLNQNDAFGKITVFGNDSMLLELIDENGSLIADYMMYSCSHLSGFVVEEDSIINVACNGDSTGAIIYNVSGGTAPYSYSLDGETYGPASMLTGLPIGTYNPAVKDASGCIKSFCVKITEPEPLEVTTSTIKPSCFGDTDGAAFASANGGVAPYVYAWSAGSATDTLLNQPKGTYQLSVTDANQCLLEQAVTINQPDSLRGSSYVINARCENATDGTINILPIGGTAPFTINWSNGQSQLTAINLAAGSYSYTLTDANNCTYSNSAIVGESVGVLLGTQITPDNGTGTGSIQLNPTGGVAPYTYNWYDGSSQSTVANLYSGLYPVTITDASGCEIDTAIQVNIGTGISTLNETNFQLYPNPATNFISLQFDLGKTDNVEIEIFNLVGKQIYKKSFVGARNINHQISTDEFSAGTILVVIKTSEGNFYKKLAIHR